MVKPFSPLTYPEAVNYVSSGFNILCRTKSDALKVAMNFPGIIWDPKHRDREGYLEHSEDE